MELLEFQKRNTAPQECNVSVELVFECKREISGHRGYSSEEAEEVYFSNAAL